ncbi:MAG: outer membrane lipoprotein-sorting protein [Elusimicrobiota bacterium]
MKKIFKYFSFIIIMLLTGIPARGEMTAEEIIARRDSNEYLTTARVESEMVIIQGNRKMSKTMETYIRGEDSLTEFTNPRDRGTKFLKRGDSLWMYFPEAEDIVKISGHMLNQGMMGSDFSYQDMMESDKLTELYNFKLTGRETLDGRPCYVLEGEAIEGKEVSYHRRKVWIDSERFVGLKEELYARSGRLLKIMKVEQVKQLEERWIPVSTVMENKLLKNSKTEFTVKSMEFNPELPENLFTLENLR